MPVELYKEIASPVQKKDISKTVNTVLKVLNRRDNFSLSVAVVKENTAQALNRRWRGINRPASVLSFLGQKLSKSQEKRGKNKNFILPFPENNFLGEIIIADSVVRRFALKRKSSYRQEFRYLFIHGFLHLLGYNHSNVRSRKIMERLEKRIKEKAS